MHIENLISPRWISLSALLFAGTALGTPASPASTAPAALPVTIDNYARAETDKVFAGIVSHGGFGQFRHFRELAPLDKQVVLRGNRDTLYSIGVFDLDAGPVTIDLPDAGKRYLTMQVIDEDHYTYATFYGAGSHRVDRGGVGTRYALVALRILVDPENPQDMAQVHALQDAVKVSQQAHGRFEVPQWDPASREKVHDALVNLGATLPDLRNGFGARDQVDPVRHLIAT